METTDKTSSFITLPKSASTPVVLMVTQKITEMIERGEIKPGDKLPAERILAQRFNVSRNSVREALHSFEALGIVKAVLGSGNYLVERTDTLSRVFSTKQLIEKYNLIELVEARKVFEVGIARLAAKNATREDKIRLRECLVDTQNYEQGEAGGVDADFRFHLEIARISKNTILIDMLSAVRDLTYTACTVLAQRVDSKQSAYESHACILDGLIANDPVAASKAMENHLHHMLVVMDQIYHETNDE